MISEEELAVEVFVRNAMELPPLDPRPEIKKPHEPGYVQINGRTFLAHRAAVVARLRALYPGIPAWPAVDRPDSEPAEAEPCHVAFGPREERAANPERVPLGDPPAVCAITPGFRPLDRERVVQMRYDGDRYVFTTECQNGPLPPAADRAAPSPDDHRPRGPQLTRAAVCEAHQDYLSRTGDRPSRTDMSPACDMTELMVEGATHSQVLGTSVYVDPTLPASAGTHVTCFNPSDPRRAANVAPATPVEQLASLTWMTEQALSAALRSSVVVALPGQYTTYAQTSGEAVKAWFAWPDGEQRADDLTAVLTRLLGDTYVWAAPGQAEVDATVISKAVAAGTAAGVSRAAFGPGVIDLFDVRPCRLAADGRWAEIPLVSVPITMIWSDRRTTVSPHQALLDIVQAAADAFKIFIGPDNPKKWCRPSVSVAKTGPIVTVFFYTHRVTPR